MPRCLIIAGPNGAGKTTFALEYLPLIAHVETFLNADLIASGLSPFAPEKQAAAAGRLFLTEIERCIEARNDFAFETTLSGKGYVKLVERLKATGWTVELYYLALPSPDMSKRRVSERVAHGGHNIPAADIDRRFPRRLRNLFNSYRMIVDKCACLLNEDQERSLVFEQSGGKVQIYDERAYQELKRQARTFGA